jgi:hypothetical protein
MQDELTKHGLKIYKTMSDRKHNFGEKFREILIEIGIIVFAVTLSIYVHSWSEHRHEQKEVREFMKGLKADLAEDMRLVNDSRKITANVQNNFDYVYRLKKNEVPDSILHHHFIYDLVTTHLNSARYEGFKSSGKIGNIENDSLKENILVYYQQTMPGITDYEEMGNGLQQKLLDFEVEKSNLSINDFLVIPKVRSLLQLSIHNLTNSIDIYDSATTQAKKIITQIDKELTH